jgi:hypothetical protein
VRAPCRRGGPDGKLVDLAIAGGVAHFPGLAAERVRRLGDLSPALAAKLLDAADAAAFFMRPHRPDIPTRLDTRTYHLRLSHGGRSRLLAISEPYASPELRRLVGIATSGVRG